MEWQKKYRWTRTWGNEPGLNGEAHEDYCGYDGQQNIGRIYLDHQTLKAGTREAIRILNDARGR